MKIGKNFVLALAGLIVMAGNAFATPSTTYWTPAVMDIQPYGVLHIGVDNYFTVFMTGKGGASAFPTDVGLTMGVLPFKKLQMELGIDLLEPSDYPVYFNAKLGVPEDALFKWSPSLNVGVFNIGAKKDATDMNIIYGVVGKTIPKVGRIHVGPYYGNRNAQTFFIKEAGDDDLGVMVGFDRGFLPRKDKDGNEFNRLVLAADYASGKNALGGGGAGIYYYFTKDISLLTGPVWFNEPSLNGEWKWTIQLDINAGLLKK
jgi:hypothetical protein